MLLHITTDYHPHNELTVLLLTYSMCTFPSNTKLTQVSLQSSNTYLYIPPAQVERKDFVCEGEANDTPQKKEKCCTHHE